MDILWDKTVKIIKEKVSQQNFETWIRPKAGTVGRIVDSQRHAIQRRRRRNMK